MTASNASNASNEPVRYVMSLGTNCVAAMSCKQAALKKFSGPFDWTFANLGVVKHCIEDDFASFLDAGQYVHVHANKNGHGMYGEHLFEHHNPLGRHDDYMYFKRCVERFRTVMQSTQRKVFVMSCFDQSGRLPSDYDDIVSFYEWLKIRTSNFVLLVMFQEECVPRSTPEYELIHDGGGLLVKCFRTLTGYNGHSIRSPEDRRAMVEYLQGVFEYDLIVDPHSEGNSRDPLFQ